MNPKVLLVIAVVLVLLFVAAVAVGAGSGDGKDGGATPAEWVSAVGKTVLEWVKGATARQRKEPRLSDRDVKDASPGRCRDLLIVGQLDLPPGERCTFDVAASRESMRALPVLLSRGSRVELDVLLYMEDEWENEDEVARGECYRLQFFDGGGELMLTCYDDGSDQPCRLEVPSAGCSP